MPNDGAVLTYRRPDVTIETYRDASGEPIPYGSRYWRPDADGNTVEPPEDVYSTCAHPERFMPVAIVGRALIDHLTAACSVERTDSVVDGRASARLTPTSGGGTSLTFSFGPDESPDVRVRAGWRYEGLWPDCGCDACDDDVEILLQELENTVLTIVNGGMSEWRSGPDPSDDDVPWHIHVEFDGPLETSENGSHWSLGEREPTEMPWTPHRWPAWPEA